MATKILVNGEKIGRPKKQWIKLITNVIKRNRWELTNKTETHDKKTAKTDGPLLARTNTRSPKVKGQMKDKMN